jgi:hypothetical protein
MQLPSVFSMFSHSQAEQTGERLGLYVQRQHDAITGQLLLAAAEGDLKCIRNLLGQVRSPDTLQLHSESGHYLRTVTPAMDRVLSESYLTNSIQCIFPASHARDDSILAPCGPTGY